MKHSYIETREAANAVLKRIWKDMSRIEYLWQTSGDVNYHYQWKGMEKQCLEIMKQVKKNESSTN